MSSSRAMLLSHLETEASGKQDKMLLLQCLWPAGGVSGQRGAGSGNRREHPADTHRSLGVWMGDNCMSTPALMHVYMASMYICTSVFVISLVIEHSQETHYAYTRSAR
eukprot:2269148-Pyramimonas_sp.AAC.1